MVWVFLKVNYFRNVLLMSPNWPQNQRNLVRISALSAPGQIKKMRAQIGWFYFDLFLEDRAEILTKISLALVDLKTPKIPFKINWPLTQRHIYPSLWTLTTDIATPFNNQTHSVFISLRWMWHSSREQKNFTFLDMHILESNKFS